MTTYSHTYNRGPQMTEAQIQQAGAAQAEAAAPNPVNLYRDPANDEIITLCQSCYQSNPAYADLEYLDKAGDFDFCGDCGAENVPGWYHPTATCERCGQPLPPEDIAAGETICLDCTGIELLAEIDPANPLLATVTARLSL